MTNCKLPGLFLAHQKSLLHYAKRLLGDAARAEDVIQDAFLRCYSASAQEQDTNIGYVYRIVRNLAYDTCRRQQYETALFCVDDEQAALIENEWDHPEQTAIDQDNIEALYGALTILPARQRQALELYYLHELKLREIAQAMGISTSMAQYLVKSGMQQCALRLVHCS